MRVKTLPIALVAALLAVMPTKAEEISEEDLRGHIAVLASDAFGGRKPGTEGENKTVNYLATQWSKASVQPAGRDGGWYEPVQLVERSPMDFVATFTVERAGGSKVQKLDEDDLAVRGRMDSTELVSVPLVYAGYGNEPAAELQALVRGKVALLPITRPAMRDDLPAYRDRKRQILEAGAAGILAIVDGDRRWLRMERVFQRTTTTLDGMHHHAAIEGMIKRDRLRKMLKQAGMPKEQLASWQADREFRPVDLPLRLDLVAQTDIRKYVSHNVIGKIAGSRPSAGAIMFLGHWDHFGQCRKPEPMVPAKDLICNGAIDNASGLALLIETAKHLSGAALERDIYFLATTAEEKGLLGTYAFAENPPFRLDRLVAAFNVDSVALTEEGSKVAVIGYGETGLEDDLQKVAASESRVIDQSANPNNFLRRQDGYVLLKRGIPAFLISSAFADQDRLNAFIDGRYHDVHDELDEGLLLGGATDDANFHVALGRYFGSTVTYPEKATSTNLAN